MRYILELSRFTSFEIIRSRAYRILIAACVLVPLISITLSNLFLFDIGKVYLDVFAGGGHFLAVAFVLFIATPLLSKDVDERVCYILMKQPVARWHFICGRFLGFTLAMILLMVALSLTGVIGSWIVINSHYTLYLSGMNLLATSKLVFFVFFQYISLIGILMFIFSWATGTAEIMVFTIAVVLFSWMFPPIMEVLQDPDIAKYIPEWLNTTLESLYNLIPHLNGGNIAQTIAHGKEIEPSGIFAYCVEHTGYALVALFLAILLFEKRDL